MGFQGGGFLKTKDFSHRISSPHVFKRTATKHQVCFTHDNQSPVHCKQQHPSCVTNPLKLDSRLKKEKFVIVQFEGWSDPRPTGGQPSQASGLHKYTIEVHEVKEKDLNALQMDESPLSTLKINASSHASPVNISLPGHIGLYAVTLTVLDQAENYRKARRFVLYDNTSVIDVNDQHHALFATGYKPTNYTWQIHHGETCIGWHGRYYNSYHKTMNMLRPIVPDVHREYTGIYEQREGILNVSGTPNGDGITHVSYRWKKDNNTYSPRQNLDSFLSERLCRDFNVSDGETISVELTNRDIMSNKFIETFKLYVDRTVPVIIDLGLYRNGQNLVFVHSEKDMSSMSMTFTAMDVHSGLYSVMWRIGTSPDSNDVGFGSLPVRLHSNAVTIFNAMI